MNCTVQTQVLRLPPINKSEVFRYAGAGTATPELEELLLWCMENSPQSTDEKPSGKVCFAVFDIVVSGSKVDFGFTSVRSENLAKMLKNSSKAVIFAATAGVQIDRLIRRYSAVSPAKALMFHAIGTERVEALCDAFCDKLKQEYAGVTPRFSPGYGDLSPEFQRDIFAVLDCSKRIGINLNKSLLISPSKSVTAVVGVG